MTSQTAVSVAHCDYGEIRAATVSLTVGEPLSIHVGWTVDKLNVDVAVVDEHEDHWVLGGSVTWDASAPGVCRIDAVSGTRQPVRDKIL